MTCECWYIQGICALCGATAPSWKEFVSTKSQENGGVFYGTDRNGQGKGKNSGKAVIFSEIPRETDPKNGD